jgi:hypothetical protein
VSAKGKKRHLTPGWCWSADIDGEPPVWGIYGHLPDDDARAIVEAYEGTPVKIAGVERDHRRSVPCRRTDCHAECNGTHLELATGPGRGSSPYTWVTGVAC